MTQEDVKPSELGAYTNNIPNSRGIKKLLSDVKALFTSMGGKQDKLTAGDNVAISDANVISATDTKYTAGNNISISEQNVISATGGADNWVVCADKWTDVLTYSKDYEFKAVNNNTGRTYYFESDDDLSNESPTSLSVYIYCTRVTGHAIGAVPLSVYSYIYKGGVFKRDYRNEIGYYYPNQLTDLKDFSGTAIDITNIDNFIDSTTFKCLAPFTIHTDATYNSTTIKGTYVVNVGDDFVSLFMTYSSYISRINVTLQKIYDYIKNNVNTSFTGTVNYWDNNPDDISTMTIYRRKKLSAMPTPTP